MSLVKGLKTKVHYKSPEARSFISQYEDEVEETGILESFMDEYAIYEGDDLDPDELDDYDLYDGEDDEDEDDDFEYQYEKMCTSLDSMLSIADELEEEPSLEENLAKIEKDLRDSVAEFNFIGDYNLYDDDDDDESEFDDAGLF